MNDHDALVAAVCADPDADLPRLMYADWCDDHGDADRAEFIRLQCAPATPGLLGRADELLKVHYAEWVEPLAAFERVCAGPGDVRFRRGFVWGVEVDDEDDEFAGYAADLFRTAPVQRVNFLHKWSHDKVATLPDLLKLRELGTDRCGFETPDLAVLFGSPYLRNLRRLELVADDDNGHVARDGLRVLGECPNLPGLRELDLSGNWCEWQWTDDRDWASDLLAGGLSAQLTELSLRGTFMEDPGAVLLAGCDKLGRLVRLDLANNAFTGRGLSALASSPHLAALRTLDLRGNHYGGDQDEGPPPEAAYPELRRRFGDGVLLGQA